MCGINGIYYKNTLDKDRLRSDMQKMNDLVIHRGPDDEGVFINETAAYGISMGMRRLSIIDLHSGQQPIYSEDRSKVIVFNGEIYNYRILKENLQKQGVVFNTTSDTEVILKLYEKYCTSSFGMLDGMFAFSIYDKSKDSLFIARDFFGEKPLYYHCTSSSFYWASELKSITNVLPRTPQLSKTAIGLYFQLTYIPAPYTIFENINKLEPNHFIVMNCLDNTIEIQPIEQPKNPSSYNDISFSEAKLKTRKFVQKSVISRSIADVPIGTFLSGGVDSSIVSICLAQQSSKPIDTFSLGFDKKAFDETDKSKTVAKLIGSNHHEFIVSLNDVKDDIDAVILNFDEPFADSSALPTYLVSKLTKQYVKVGLTGDGGDEVFGGYNKYYMGKLNRRYTKLIPKDAHCIFTSVIGKVLKTKDDNRGIRFKLNRLMKAINYDNDFYFRILSLGFQEEEIAFLLTDDHFLKGTLDYYKNAKTNSLNDFRNIDRRISLEGDLLVKVDRTSMLNSLECRAPFLNKELWNFTSQLPENFLIKGWNKKYILKEAFKEYFPEKFLDKSKKGFGVPIGDWLRAELKHELLSYINPHLLEKQRIFNKDFITKLVMNHINGIVDNTFRVWTFFCFQKWYVKQFNNL